MKHNSQKDKIMTNEKKIEFSETPQKRVVRGEDINKKPVLLPIIRCEDQDLVIEEHLRGILNRIKNLSVRFNELYTDAVINNKYLEKIELVRVAYDLIKEYERAEPLFLKKTEIYVDAFEEIQDVIKECYIPIPEVKENERILKKAVNYGVDARVTTVIEELKRLKESQEEALLKEVLEKKIESIKKEPTLGKCKDHSRASKMNACTTLCILNPKRKKLMVDIATIIDEHIPPNSK